MNKRGQDNELVSMLMFILIALALGSAMIHLSDRYSKDSSTKMAFYTIDNAFLINTMLIPPGAIIANYSLDVAKYEFEIEDGFLLLNHKKFGDSKYPVSTSKNIEISLKPSEKNYYHKMGDLFLSSTKASKPVGLTCPNVNTTKINYKILFDPQDDFSYIIYDAIKSSKSYLVNAKGQTKSSTQIIDSIKINKHDIYLKFSHVPDNENYVITFVPFNNLNSTKAACLIVNFLGLYTDNILVVHSDLYDEFNYATDPVILEIHGDINAYEAQKNINEAIERYFS